MNRNASLCGAVPINRGQQAHVRGLFGKQQQGAGNRSNHSLSDQSSWSSPSHILFSSGLSGSSGPGGIPPALGSEGGDGNV